MQGYDKFFKQARKASQSGQGNRAAPTAKSQKNRRFAMNEKLSPEAELKRVMAERVRARKAQKAAKAKERAPFPVGALVTVIAGLGIATAGLLNPEAVEFVMDNVEIGVFGDARAADQAKPEAKANPVPTEKAAEKTAGAETKAAEKTAAATDAPKGEKMPDTRGWSTEEVSFFNKLGERKRELDLREAELAKLEEELQKQRLELDEKLKQLEAMRSQIAQTLKSRVQNDQEKVSKLVDVYSGMKPQQAAKVIETINEDLAVQILDRMKKAKAADILNVMDASKAQKLSEMLAGYKRAD